MTGCSGSGPSSSRHLRRLAPAWAELRAVLNELNTVLVSDVASRQR